MVKSEGFLVPPLALATSVITFRNVNEPGRGSFGFLVECEMDVPVEVSSG
jgi:hypothetical protein